MHWSLLLSPSCCFLFSSIFWPQKTCINTSYKLNGLTSSWPSHVKPWKNRKSNSGLFSIVQVTKFTSWILLALILEVNDLACEILKFSREELIGKHFRELKSERYAGEVKKNLDMIRHFGQYRYETEMLPVTGSRFHWKWRAGSLNTTEKRGSWRLPVISRSARRLKNGYWRRSSLQKKTNGSGLRLTFTMISDRSFPPSSCMRICWKRGSQKDRPGGNGC